MFKVLDLTAENLIAIEVEGKIEKADYEKLNPLLEKTVKEHETINLLIRFREIEGLSLPALVADFNTYLKYRKNMNKVALVGDSQIENAIGSITDLFMKADVEYFPVEEYLKAENWIKS